MQKSVCQVNSVTMIQYVWSVRPVDTFLSNEATKAEAIQLDKMKYTKITENLLAIT